MGAMAHCLAAFTVGGAKSSISRAYSPASRTVQRQLLRRPRQAARRALGRRAPRAPARGFLANACARPGPVAMLHPVATSAAAFRSQIATPATLLAVGTPYRRIA